MFSVEFDLWFVIDDLRVDQSFCSTRALKQSDFRYLFILYFRKVSFIFVTLRLFRALVLRIMSSGDFLVPPSDPELRFLLEDFDWGGFEQSQSSITENLRSTLPYQTDPEESGAPKVPRGSRVEHVLENV